MCVSIYTESTDTFVFRKIILSLRKTLLNLFLKRLWRQGFQGSRVRLVVLFPFTVKGIQTETFYLRKTTGNEDKGKGPRGGT